MKQRKDSIVFSPGSIGNIQIKNRLARSATYENAATMDGRVTETLIEIYRELAGGGVGLIITGLVGVWERAVAPHRIMGNYDDSYIMDLEKISKAVHETDKECRVFAQLYHPGRQVLHPEDMANFSKYLPKLYLSYLQKHPEVLKKRERPKQFAEKTAPSPVTNKLFGTVPRELGIDEIDEIIDAFADAVSRAEEAGFDGVQLHAAHGYLLSSFLSPYTNKRDDLYGGSTENRARIITEIYKRGKKKVGKEFPVIIKFNTTDLLPDGIDNSEAVKIGKILSETGFAAVETSGGMWESVTHGEEQMGWPPVLLAEARTGIKTREQEAYFLPAAAALKKDIQKPVILVGGLRSFDRIEEILESGDADFISLSRPLIRQPGLPSLWLSGSGKDRADCISCNACISMGDEPLRCRVKKE